MNCNDQQPETFFTIDILTCQSRKNTSATNDNNDNTSPVSYNAELQCSETGTPKQNAAIINIIYTCVFSTGEISADKRVY